MHHVMEERDSERAIGAQEESGDGPDPEDRRVYSELGALVMRSLTASAAVAPS